MKVLAVAKINEKYIWKDTFTKCKIEAVLEGGNVSFLEYFNGHVNTLREGLIQELFAFEYEDYHDRPLLVKDNEDLYTILHRREPEFKSKFEEILERANKKVTFKRANHEIRNLPQAVVKNRIYRRK